MRRYLVLLTALAAVSVATAVPAAAHGDEGTMSITEISSRGLTVHISVGVTHEDDGHLATEAEVSAELTGPSGQVVGPVTLPRVGDGAVYEADIEVPAAGSWSVQVTSENPTANATTSVGVEEPLPTTTETAPPTTEDPTNTTLPPSTTEPGGSDDGSTATDGDDDGNGLLIGVAIAAGVLLLAGAGWALARSRNG